MTDAKKVRELIAKLAAEKGPEYVITDADMEAIVKEATPAERGGLFNKLFSGAGTPAATTPNDLSQLAEVFREELKPLQDEITSLKTENQKLSETQKAIVDGQKSQEEMAKIAKVHAALKAFTGDGRIAMAEGEIADTPEKYSKYQKRLMDDYDSWYEDISARPAKAFDNTKPPVDNSGGDKDKGAALNPLMSGIPENFANYAKKALDK